METVRIVCTDANSRSLRVIRGDGSEIKNITRIEFEPIVPSGPILVRVTQTFVASVDMAAKGLEA